MSDNDEKMRSRVNVTSILNFSNPSDRYNIFCSLRRKFSTIFLVEYNSMQTAIERKAYFLFPSNLLLLLYCRHDREMLQIAFIMTSDLRVLYIPLRIVVMEMIALFYLSSFLSMLCALGKYEIKNYNIHTEYSA